MTPSQAKTLAAGFLIGASFERIRGAIKFGKMVKKGSVILVPKHVLDSVKAGDIWVYVLGNK